MPVLCFLQIFVVRLEFVLLVLQFGFQLPDVPLNFGQITLHINQCWQFTHTMFKGVMHNKGSGELMTPYTACSGPDFSYCIGSMHACECNKVPSYVYSSVPVHHV